MQQTSYFFVALSLIVAFLQSGGICVKGSAPNLSADNYDESLIIHPVSARSFLAIFEWKIDTEVRSPQGAYNFDLFPRDVAKLLLRLPLHSFTATLTQGRWAKEHWGAAPIEVAPPGAALRATVSASEAYGTWRNLVHAVGGLTGSTMGQLDDRTKLNILPERRDEPDKRTLYASIPTEPVCTENLSPFIKLLPCGTSVGATIDDR
eukprot:GHVU01138592.1.p1 GENE.GHVU01138592.1~~GHVU01138592.1.p1  ORF type:complete len:206 (+),score=27.23 GHVU01138592.1:206-823(+)